MGEELGEPAEGADLLVAEHEDGAGTEGIARACRPTRARGGGAAPPAGRATPSLKRVKKGRE